MVQHIKSTPMQAITIPAMLDGLTRNSTTLSTKIARLRQTSAAAQYLSDVCKTYRLSTGSLFIIHGHHTPGTSFSCTGGTSCCSLKTWKRNQSDGISTSIPISAVMKNAHKVAGGLAAFVSVKSGGMM